MIVPDIDHPGEDSVYGGVGYQHAKKVLASVSLYADAARIVEFTYNDFEEILDGGDVTDYLRLHSVEEF